MTRTLTSNITASKDLTAYSPVFVVVVSDGTNVLGRFTTYAPLLEDWGGAGVDADGLIAKMGDIRHEIDWRGGLSHMSELDIDLIDDGTLAAALVVDHPYTVEVWFCFDDGSPTSAESIMLYEGALDSWSIAWGMVKLHTSDIRERRYPKTVLTKVSIDNEASLCGYGLERSSDTAWNLDIAFHEEWIPENSKGALVPICFGQPRKARGLLVSRWIGADDLADGAPPTGRYLRGPLFLFSDMRLQYGDDDGNMDSVQTLYHYDDSRKIYSKLTDIGEANLNDCKMNFLDEFGDHLAAVFRPVDSDNNALKATESISFLMRMKPRTEDVISANVANNPLVLRSPISGSIYNGIRRAWVAQATPSEYLLHQKLEDLSQQGLVRCAWHEVNIEIASGALAGAAIIGIRINSGTVWGVAMSYASLLSGSVALFNNWEDSPTANKAFTDAQVLSGGTNPFGVGSSIGPLPISSFADPWIDLYLSTAGSTSTAEMRYYGGNLIVACDVQLEDVRMAADINQSFDGYYVEGGPVSINPSQSIYATLCAMFGLTSGTDTVASADWIPPSDSAVPYTSLHDADRLDFQLAEDMSGKDLIDTMCRDGSLYVVHDQSGREAPKHFRRVDDTSSGPHLATINQDVVKTGSFGPIRQGSVDDLYTSFRVRYSANPTTGDFEKEYWVDEASGNLPATHLSLLQGWCSNSQSDYGLKRELLHESTCIQDDASALSLLMCMAAKHVRRPRMFGLTTWLNALDIEVCDIPCIDHPLWKTAAQKCGGSSAVYETPYPDDYPQITRLNYCGVLDEYTTQRGDWVRITSLSLVAAGLAGWYRVRDVSASSGWIYLFADSLGATAYTNVTWYVLPAMMVTSANIRTGTAEIDLEFVEIPRAPESVGEAWVV